MVYRELATNPALLSESDRRLVAELRKYADAPMPGEPAESVSRYRYYFLSGEGAERVVADIDKRTAEKWRWVERAMVLDSVVATKLLPGPGVPF